MLEDFSEPFEARPDALQKVPERLFKPLIWIFIGPDGSGSALHRDVLDTHAWLAVVQGRKRIALHPPGALEQDYDAHRHEAAEVLRRSQGHGLWRYVELGKGDLMLIPSRWWHEVVNNGSTLGLTRNFATPDIHCRVGASARMQGWNFLCRWLGGEHIGT